MRVHLILVAWLSLLLVDAQPLVAATWRAVPNLLPPSTSERLAERHPLINNANDLESLIVDIGRRHPMLQVEAYLDQGVWTIRGKSATLIADLSIHITARMMAQQVYAAVQSFVGQVDSPESRQKLVDIVQRYLVRHGYPWAKTTLSTSTNQEGTVYDVHIDEGIPCIIDRVNLNFALPGGLKPDLRAGDACDLELIETSVGDFETQLRDLGYSQARLEPASIVLHAAAATATVDIKGDLGRRIRYQIIDDSRRFILDQLFEDDELTNFDPNVVSPDAMKAELSRRYRNLGYLDIEVKGPTTLTEDEGTITYVYHVTPGRQYLLKSVQFEGINFFNAKQAQEIMGVDRLWQSSQPYNYEEIQQGIAALKYKYQQEGYWDVDIHDPGTGQRDKETATVRLTISVTEGMMRVLNDIYISGNKAINDGEILALLSIKRDTPIDRSKLLDFQQKLRATYVGKGYLYSDVQIELKLVEAKKTQRLDLYIRINEGQRVKFGDINIVGITRTDEKVVRRELLFHPGDWYDPDLITNTRQALSRLGIFRSVQIVPADRNAIAEKEAELDINIDIREGRPGTVNYGPGWSLIRGWNYEAEAAYNNIGGVGRQASIRGSISQERNQYAIGPKTLFGRKLGVGYTEPFIFDIPIDGIIRARQEAFWNGELWTLSYAGELELKHRFRRLLPNSFVSVFYGQKVANTEGSQFQLATLVAPDEQVGSVGFRYNVDRRDNLRFPTGGYVANAEISWARYELNGNVRYFKWDLGLGKYLELGKDTVFALGTYATGYEDIQRKGQRRGILPQQERLSSGDDTVRGFPIASLGPLVRAPVFTDDGSTCRVSYTTNALFGSNRLSIKSELRHKFSDAWAATAFVDSGTVFLSREQMSRFKDEYSGPVTDPNIASHPNCQNYSPAPVRTVEDNFAYDFGDLLRHPGYIWTRNYYSYGGSLDFLTALGAINITYGLPWREPKTQSCRDDPRLCNKRARQTGHWITRGEFLFNIGARF
ncbi:MAG: hypothetical protein FJ146_09380 [Deltaproteobacteria bacterium]|nr:hypothetical protein [Deltaproteobacteria bacterium]